MEKKNIWLKYQDGQREQVMEFAERYRQFISKCKTERECVDELVVQAREAGFTDLRRVLEEKQEIKAGDKLYITNMGKSGEGHEYSGSPY